AVALMGQQVGLVTNARDAAERIRLEGWDKDLPTRQAGREAAAMGEGAERLKPLVVETRRGPEQLQRIRETLARAELCDAMPFAALVLEAAGRLPRDATVVAVLPDVPVETAIALGSLRRHGFAVTAVLVAFEGRQFERAYGRLLAEGIRDVRHLRDEAGLPTLCRRQIAGASAIYFDEPEGEEETAEAPGWAQQTPLGMTDAEED
ncbi:MAG TPA: hypothetical protein VFA26_06250, partial [Gemmataceae bacterium]|nr:hypothetical protein [Gemmataceae bacterium]